MTLSIHGDVRDEVLDGRASELLADDGGRLDRRRRSSSGSRSSRAARSAWMLGGTSISRTSSVAVPLAAVLGQAARHRRSMASSSSMNSGFPSAELHDGAHRLPRAAASTEAGGRSACSSPPRRAAEQHDRRVGASAPPQPGALRRGAPGVPCRCSRIERVALTSRRRAPRARRNSVRPTGGHRVTKTSGRFDCESLEQHSDRPERLLRARVSLPGIPIACPNILPRLVRPAHPSPRARRASPELA